MISCLKKEEGKFVHRKRKVVNSMSKVYEPLSEEKKLVQVLESDTNAKKVAIFFWHGLGDCIQFQDLFTKLELMFQDVQFDMLLQKGLGQETLFPSVVLVDSSTKLEEMDYDYVFKVHFPVEQDPTLTKIELCNKLEIGIPNYISRYNKVRYDCASYPSRLVGIHYCNTAMPDTFNVPENIAKKIWYEVIEAGFIPIEVEFLHPFHNPVNIQFPFVNCTVRGVEVNIENLFGLIQSCTAILAVPSGPLHCALAMKPERVLYLEREIPINRFTHDPVASIDVKNYKEGSVKEWLERLDTKVEYKLERKVSEENIPLSTTVEIIEDGITSYKILDSSVESLYVPVDTIVEQVSDYAYYVGADYKYVPELCALLNSLDYVGNKQDVHIIGINLPDDFVNQFASLNYRVIHHVILQEEVETERGISEIVCRKRYWYAGEGLQYKAICVLDADLIFNRDPIQFFEIAEKTGFILGISKEQNKVYDDEHHTVNGQFIIPQGYWNDKDLCNCPLFVDPNIWGEALKRSWDIFIYQGFKAPDMDAMNICLIAANGHDKIVRLPGLQWLGTNEQHLKTYTKACLKGEDGKLWTENGLEIFCFHGQFYHDKWREQQLLNRKQCIAGRMDGSEKAYGDAVSGLEVLTQVFNTMLDYKIKIEKLDYRHSSV